MNPISVSQLPIDMHASASTVQHAHQLNSASQQNRPSLREAFDQFVGETFFSQMISAMRKTTDKPAYFHGGRAEEVFQGQLDQMLAERMSEASAEQFSGPMFELFQLGRPH